MEIVMKDFISFEWDENKRLINIEKHGIDFLRAAKVLSMPHLEKRSDQKRREPGSGHMSGNGHIDRNCVYDAWRRVPDHIGKSGETK